MIALILAAALPEVPRSSVQIVPEGDILVMRNLIDDNPLYTFDLDEPAHSRCDDECAVRWRPLRVSGSDEPVGDWAQITRGDGSLQWTYKGRPVYSFAQDPEHVTIKSGESGTWRRLTMLSPR